MPNPTKTSPLADALVTVHYDSLPAGDFFRSQIEQRIRAYSDCGLPLYSLSTHAVPPSEPNVVHIPSPDPTGDTYGLEQQMESLLHTFPRSPRLARVEVVGVAWFLCVDAVHAFLIEHGIEATINYDCTDLVGDYVGIIDLGIPLPEFNGKPMPKPPEAVIAAYRQYLTSLPSA